MNCHLKAGARHSTGAALGRSNRPRHGLLASVSTHTQDMTFRGYQSQGFFDEMIGEDGLPRSGARLLAQEIESLPPGEIAIRQQMAERALIQAGITFNVYSDRQGVEKTMPFDLVPRIVPGPEWKLIERTQAADSRAESLHSRSLSRPEDPQRRRGAL